MTDASLRSNVFCNVFFRPVYPTFTIGKRRDIYYGILEKVARILSAMKESGQAARETVWRIAVESWLRSRDYIKPNIKTKLSPDFSSFLARE